MHRSLATLLLLALAAAPGVAAELRILFTNDIQGRFSPRERVGDRSSGGASALWDIVQEERAAVGPSGDVLLVDSGDFLYGGLRSGSYGGAPAIAVMNALGYHAAGLGNHEFDRTTGTLRLRATEARFPLLCANLYQVDARHGPRGVRPSVLVPLPNTGVQVGVIGVVGPDLLPGGEWTRRHGLEVGPVIPAVRREVDRLRGQGAQMIVVLSHQGLRADRRMLEETAELVDILLGGHTPTARVQTRRLDVPILQARAEGIELGRLRVPVTEGAPDPARATVTWIPWAIRDATQNPAQEILDRYPIEFAPLARTPRRFSLAETAGWILDTMLATARAEGHRPAVALLNRGALRAGLPRGQVSEIHLHQVAPFDNNLLVVDYPADLLRSLATEGRGSRRGSHLLWRFADGQRDPLVALPARGTVSVVLNDFLAYGGDRYRELDHRGRGRSLPDTLRQALRLQLQATSAPVTPPEPVPGEWLTRPRLEDLGAR